MKAFLVNRHFLRQHWLSIVGFSLLSYFMYHALLGERSYVRLLKLERDVAEISSVYEENHHQRLALESRVIKLRPGSIDRDLLEERAHYVLGYYHPDEQVFLNRTGNGS